MSHALHVPQTVLCEKNTYTYFRTIGLSNLKLTGLATMHQVWLNLLQINRCFQVLLDPDSKRYPVLSKLTAEVLAAFAECVWWWGMVTLATCNSCRQRPHWDMVYGENIVPCCCLESTPCRVSPSAFQKWRLLAHWGVTQDEQSYSTKGMSFVVCSTWLSGEPVEAFFPAWDKSAQDGIIQFLGFALPSSFSIFKSFLQAQSKYLGFSGNMLYK